MVAFTRPLIGDSETDAATVLNLKEMEGLLTQVKQIADLRKNWV